MSQVLGVPLPSNPKGDGGCYPKEKEGTSSLQESFSFVTDRVSGVQYVFCWDEGNRIEIRVHPKVYKRVPESIRLGVSRTDLSRETGPYPFLGATA